MFYHDGTGITKICINLEDRIRVEGIIKTEQVWSEVPLDSILPKIWEKAGEQFHQEGRAILKEM